MGALVVVTYLIQVLGGRLHAATSIIAILITLMSLAWVFSGQRPGPWSLRPIIACLVILLVAGASHLILPATTTESAVLLSDVTAVTDGNELVVRGTIDHLGVAHGVPLAVTAGKVSLANAFILRTVRTFSIIIKLENQDPCVVGVRVRAAHQTPVGPLSCQSSSR